jgi:uncharacterized protein YbbK (DUF523 family)
MSILISACLLGINCRYDGGNCLTKQARELVRSEAVAPVCPEQLGGLSTPRSGAVITIGSGKDVLAGRSKVLTGDGADVTQEFIRGAQEVVQIARLFGVRKAVLKQKSPSCGCGQICRGDRVVSGDGVTAALLKREGIPILSL